MNGTETTTGLRKINVGTEQHRDCWITLAAWLEKIEVSSVTAWRWRKRGWLKTIRIGGRLFIRPQDLAEFEQRASLGEFGSRNSSKS